ncbi:MAG: DUF853 family protein [Deltaproteobacteria bacterium]|jgi:hypothetical protein|nr:DUF853 family protein [Deltaproteobacteria bacterium]
MEMETFRQADFDSIISYREIWSDSIIDIPEIHSQERRIFAIELEKILNSPDQKSPMGLRFTGVSGSGKTHLLGTFRRMAEETGAFFIYVDLTSAVDFWSKVRDDALNSLLEPDRNNVKRAVRLIGRVLEAARIDKAKAPAATFVKFKPQHLAKNVDTVLTQLDKNHPVETVKYRDLIRAFFFFAASNPNTAVIGHNWFLGHHSYSKNDQYGFQTQEPQPQHCLEGLTWLMGLEGGATVIVIDQMDNLFNQHALSQINPQAAMDNFAWELASLTGRSHRCLAVVSCIYATLQKMESQVQPAALARYRTISNLSSISKRDVIESLIAGRMRPAFEKTGFRPPYPSWPFDHNFIKSKIGATPREILFDCCNYQQQCLLAGRFQPCPGSVIRQPDSPSPAARTDPALKNIFKEIKDYYWERFNSADPEEWRVPPAEEPKWGEAIMAFARCFCQENIPLLPPDTALQIIVPTQKAKKNQNPALHAYLNYNYCRAQGTDRFLGIRALLRTHHSAIINCLSQAMTGTGISPTYPNRRLAIIRYDTVFTGAKTNELVRLFNHSSGLWKQPEEMTIRHLEALLAVTQKFPAPSWLHWAKETKPTNSIPFLKNELAWLLNDDSEAAAGGSPAASQNPDPKNPSGGPASPPESESGPDGAGCAPAPEPASAQPVTLSRAGVFIGRTDSVYHSESFCLDQNELVKHTIIFGASGCGKTVLLRRLVEEAALSGIPSLVIDIGNDLVRLGQQWPDDRPEMTKGGTAWDQEDARKAADYFSRVAVRILTPGLNRGRPFTMTCLPDLTPEDGDDDLDPEISLISDSLAASLQLSSKDGVKQAILKSAVSSVYQAGPNSFDHLIEILENPPPDIVSLAGQSQRKIQDLASSLRALIVNNVLFKPGPVTSIDRLMAPAAKTAVTVFNLSSLGGIATQQTFVGQLLAAIFAWAKKNPQNCLSGLIVIDEAKDFAPSLSSPPSKPAFIRLASQFRKYGFGLVLATQEPRSVDNQITGNCSTQIFGHQKAPASINNSDKLLGLPGAVGGLSQGRFYVKSGSLKPVKIKASLSLSAHIGAAGQDEIIDLAKKSEPL